MKNEKYLKDHQGDGQENNKDALQKFIRRQQNSKLCEDLNAGIGFMTPKEYVRHEIA